MVEPRFFPIAALLYVAKNTPMPPPDATGSQQLTQHDWTSLRTELIWVYDRAVDHGNRVFHSDLGEKSKLWLLRRGWVTIQTGPGPKLKAKAGEWVFLPREHTLHRFSDDAQILSLQFLCQWPSGQSLFPNEEILIVPSQRFPKLEEEAMRLLGMIQPWQREQTMQHAHQLSGYSAFLQTQAVFLEWLAQWFEARQALGSRMTLERRGDDRTLALLRTLNETPLDLPFPKAALETSAQLGEAQINRLFLATFGVTTRKYWERRRLEFAKTALEGGSSPVKEIAYRLAFRSDSHFVTWFRRWSGLRPSEYRRLYAFT